MAGKKTKGHINFYNKIGCRSPEDTPPKRSTFFFYHLLEEKSSRKPDDSKPVLLSTLLKSYTDESNRTKPQASSEEPKESREKDSKPEVPAQKPAGDSSLQSFSDLLAAIRNIPGGILKSQTPLPQRPPEDHSSFKLNDPIPVISKNKNFIIKKK